MPELEGVPMTIVEMLERAAEPIGVVTEGRWQLPEQRPELRRSQQRLDSLVEKRQVLGDLGQALDVRDVPADLDREDEPRRGLGHPARHNSRLRQAIERRVQLDRVETLGVVGEPIALRKARGIEDTSPPMRVVPPRTADPQLTRRFAGRRHDSSVPASSSAEHRTDCPARVGGFEGDLPRNDAGALVAPLLNRPYWLEHATSDYPSLTRDLDVEVAVIGGGITGLTAAHLLKQAGKTVAVLEMNRIGYGATGYTTAKLAVGHSLVYAALTESYDVETASRYARSNQEAIEQVAGIVSELSIECDFERASNYVYTESRESVATHRARSRGGTRGRRRR